MTTITATRLNKNKWLVKITKGETYHSEEAVLRRIRSQNLVVFRNYGGEIYASDEDTSIKHEIDNRTEDQIFSDEQEKAIKANGDDKIDDYK